MLGDQQLIRVIGMQVAGYLKWCSISFYHFRIIACLALLSTVTHFLSLVFLREYFEQRKRLRVLRTVFVVINVLLMADTIILVLAFSHKKLGYGSMVLCFYTTRGGRVDLGGTVAGIFGVVLVLSSLILALRKMSWSKLPISHAMAAVWVLCPIYIAAAVIVAPLGLREGRSLRDDSLA